MSRIPRNDRWLSVLARLADPPGRAEPRPSQPFGQKAVLAIRPVRHGLAAWFAQRLAAAASVTASQIRPTPISSNSRRRTITAPRWLPRTIQLCIHCGHNPGGFWVSPSAGQTTRRPWCLSCCQDLDPGHYHITPFEN